MLNQRWFGGRPVHAELSPVTDFREACCRQYELGYSNYSYLSSYATLINMPFIRQNNIALVVPVYYKMQILHTNIGISLFKLLSYP